MRNFFLFFSITLFIFLSCDKKKKKNIENKIIKSEINFANDKIINSIGESLKPTTKKEIANWKEYELVDDFLVNYYAISYTEALLNAKELSGLVTNLKDSLKIKELKKPSIQTRINILQNECLRLNDMANISAITPEEVGAEVTKVLEAFSALNAKLNSLYTLKDLENKLELDPDFKKLLQEEQNKAPYPDTVKNDKSIQKKHKLSHKKDDSN